MTVSDRPQGSSAVYTIDPDRSFVDVLAAGLLTRAGDDPLDLAAMTVLLPTRRACRSLREAFLRAADGKAAVLPRMMPLGDLDEEELAFHGADAGMGFPAGAALPGAMGSVQRQMLLARLILAGHGALHEDAEVTHDQAARLAAELGKLIDSVQTEGLNFDGLKGLAPESLAAHWQDTLEFLDIVTTHWPNLLAAHQAMDPAARRNAVLQAQADAWEREPPAHPVIAAGSTGSIPATAHLLRVIARMPGGAVVLPGLDRALDDAVWAGLDEPHPQYGLKKLLETIEAERTAVPDWYPSVGHPSEARRGASGLPPVGRTTLIREATRPAQTTEAWRDLPDIPETAIRDVTWIEANTPREEALAIALMLRETLESQERTAALVTPDRTLAHRVANELARWGVTVDDSAGRPLALTPPAMFLRLTADLVAGGFAPVDLLAALKHPLAAAGREPGAFRAFVRRLEVAVLRGPRPAEGIEGLRTAVRAADPRDLSAHDQAALLKGLDGLERLSAPFTALMAEKDVPLGELLQAHIAFAEALAATDDEAGAQRLWRGDAGEGLANFVSELHEAVAVLPGIEPRRYGPFLEVMMAGRVVRPRYGGHPRIAILGPLEARLQHADLMILGGLNEGTWPPEPETDPWMSRPMRKAFGLPGPERRIGLSAHDFAQAFCAPTVVLTRSKRVDGTPTVPSRWLLRLDTVLTAAGLKDKDLPSPLAATHWLDWARLMDAAARLPPVAPPAPKPPLTARPTALSVTQIETWMRDPYGIYARHILGLKALDPLDADPGAADYGSIVHDVLEAFVRDYPDALPDDAYAKLIAKGEAVFAPLMARPGVWAFWWPRFTRVARWFAAHEAKRRPDVVRSHLEVWGDLKIGETFTVKAKADRIDELSDGTLAVIDYKTGTPPSTKEVQAGYAPQLPLEAVIAMGGGIAGVPPKPVSQLLYWHLQGGRNGGKEVPVKADAGDLAREALDGVKGLVDAFARQETPYEARPVPDFAPRYSDYGHLARVKEWASGDGEGGE